MIFEHRTFTVAKDASRPQENQDAAAVDPARKLAAVSDGAASSLFAGRWARLLVDAVVAQPPDTADMAAFAPWLAARREAWQSGIDVGALAWHQKARLADGAFATLVWVELSAARGGGALVRATAIGDSCLLHVRGGRVVRTFPMEKSSQFGTDPALMGSTPRQSAAALTFHADQLQCQTGDFLVLATDAVAAWSIAQLEAGQTLGLESLWDMDAEDYARWIDRLRKQQQIRFDDSTVLLLRISAQNGSLRTSADHREDADPLAKLGRWAKRLFE